MNVHDRLHDVWVPHPVYSELQVFEGRAMIRLTTLGSGGRSLEELIRDGFVVGVLDITTHEIADYLLGGVLSAGPDRLTAAGEMGIPQVIAPGGLDLINFGPKETVPQKFLKETDQPGRGLYVHNPTVTCVGVSTKNFMIGEHIARNNAAKGPTAILY